MRNTGAGQAKGHTSQAVLIFNFLKEPVQPFCDEQEQTWSQQVTLAKASLWRNESVMLPI